MSKPKETPNPTTQELLAFAESERQQLEGITPENCPYFHAVFVEDESPGEIRIAYCEKIQVLLGYALQLGAQANPRQLDRPDQVIIYPRKAGELYSVKIASTHFFVTDSGSIGFSVHKGKATYRDGITYKKKFPDKEIWLLVESPVTEQSNGSDETDAALLAFPFARVRDAIRARNEAWGINIPFELRDLSAPPLEPKSSKTRPELPSFLPHPTFMEARQFAGAISDGRDGRYWGEIPGALALLHCPPKSKLETRYEPGAMMLNWWGVPSAQPQTLYDELARLDFDDVILFQVVLSAILHTEKARWSNISLDSIIKLIGRDTDARRSSETRQKWRNKVWRSLVLFNSMAVCGTRPGVWREPGAKSEKRVKMDAQTLYSRDPLIRIVGTRDTEQGTFDGSAPPKEVSIVPGDWLMQFHGNRQFLSEMGNVLQIAQISRGKPSGAWAACAGLMLNQLWREEVTRAPKGRNSRGKETKTEVLRFRPFTRRELLADTVRSAYDVNSILSDPKNRGERVRTYWNEAVKELKKAGVVGHYAERKTKPGEDWRAEWLDQLLDIRPIGETLENALTIHDTATKAKRRNVPRTKPKQAPQSDG